MFVDILLVILFAIVGYGLIALDKKSGKSAFRFFYDLWHKDPLPQNEERGFLVNQSGLWKLLMSALVCLIIFASWSLTLGFEPSFILSYIVDTFAIWGGMMFGANKELIKSRLVTTKVRVKRVGTVANEGKNLGILGQTVENPPIMVNTSPQTAQTEDDVPVDSVTPSLSKLFDDVTQEASEPGLSESEADRRYRDANKNIFGED